MLLKISLVLLIWSFLIDQITCFVFKGFYRGLKSNNKIKHSYLSTTLPIATESPSVKSSGGDFGDVFVTQKNMIVLESMLSTGANITEKAREYLNYCDESFNMLINTRIAETENSTEKQLLGRIRYEVNMARRNRLVEADVMLRDILSAGGLKQMEGKLYAYLRRGEIDMAFMVILQLNIEDAISANVVTAVQVMKHLATLITEYQDKLMSPPVLLLRLLVRENDSNVRKQMLRQKLLVGPNLARVGQPLAPMQSAQCEHIFVQAVESWGGPDVTVKEIEDTITDIIAQMQGGEEQARIEIESQCALLRREVEEVVKEMEGGSGNEEVCDKHGSPGSSQLLIPTLTTEVPAVTAAQQGQECCGGGSGHAHVDGGGGGIAVSTEDEEVTLL